MKRLFDLCCASLALVILSPIMLIVALAVYWQDRGPVFFLQRRTGLHGTEFGMFKFRSMCVDAERQGGYSTLDGDPRITPVGRFIRRTSLDELPQIINVIKGDMSIVGPRPDVPEQKSLYLAKEWTLRHQVRPGITGLAQATLRSAATPMQRKEMDLRYAQTAGMALDLKIIAMTIKQVLTKGGN